MSINISNKAPNDSTDLSMLRPICYLTEPVNRALQWLLNLLFSNVLASFLILAVVYTLAVAIVNTPMFDIDRNYILYVALSPLIIPIVSILSYLGGTLILLAFFARNPATRIGSAVIVEVLVLGPQLIMAMGDTRLLLILGDYFSIFLIIANLLLIPWLAFRYQTFLLRYAYLCLPTLVLLITFIWFEYSQGFSYTRISPEQFSIVSHKRVTPTSKNGVHGTSYYVCDVVLDYNGYQYKFNSMLEPDNKVEYMEVRQAFFQHFRLR